MESRGDGILSGPLCSIDVPPHVEVPVVAGLLAAVRDRRVAAVWQRRFVTFYMGAPHILSSAAHPTNACSSQMWPHLKGKKTGLPRSIDTIKI